MKVMKGAVQDSKSVWTDRKRDSPERVPAVFIAWLSSATEVAGGDAVGMGQVIHDKFVVGYPGRIELV
jgi:hypothetical protein